MVHCVFVGLGVLCRIHPLDSWIGSCKAITEPHSPHSRTPADLTCVCVLLRVTKAPKLWTR